MTSFKKNLINRRVKVLIVDDQIIIRCAVEDTGIGISESAQQK